MDTLTLVSNGTVRIDVNGIPLQSHLVESVRHLGSRTADAARAYVDVDLSGIDLGDHFYGRSDHTWAPLDDEEDDVLEDPMLLGCSCGHDDCSPVTARITVTDETVTWSDFRSDLGDATSLVGTFTFERQQYDHAIATAKLPELSKRRRLFRRVGEEGLEPPTVRV